MSKEIRKGWGTEAQTAKPDFDTTNLGLLFPQNDAAEIAYIIMQIPHKWKLTTDLYPHVHWVQSQADVAVWKIDYRWYKNGADPTGGFTTLTGAAHAYTYTAGSILQLTSFTAISGAGIDTVSSMLDIKLYRDDNTVAGDVLLKEFDIHFQIDSPGSDAEGSKSF